MAVFNIVQRNDAVVLYVGFLNEICSVSAISIEKQNLSYLYLIISFLTLVYICTSIVQILHPKFFDKFIMSYIDPFA